MSLALFAGCATAPDHRPGPAASTQRIDSRGGVTEPVAAERPAREMTQPDARARRAAAIATDQVGIPYRYGGANPAGFDCSGLVHFAYGQVGIRTPRTTSALWQNLAPVSTPGLEVGDILFFDIEGKVAHVGLYLGRGRFVHAPSSGQTVTVASLDDPFYRQAFIRGGRLEAATR